MKLFPVLILACLTACTEREPKNGVMGNGSYRFVEIAGQPVLEPSPEFASRPAPYLSFAQDSGNGATTITGYSGCNEFSRVIDVRDPETNLQVQATDNFCGEDMTVQELHILEILSGYPKFGFDDNIQTMWVTGENGRKLVGKSIGRVRASPEGSWTVATINGERAPRNSENSTITVLINGSQIQATSQCITFRWDYELRDAALKTTGAPLLDEKGDPRPMCARGLSDQEKKFADVIDDAISFGFNSSDQMVINSARGSLAMEKR